MFSALPYSRLFFLLSSWVCLIGACWLQGALFPSSLSLLNTVLQDHSPPTFFSLVLDCTQYCFLFLFLIPFCVSFGGKWVITLVVLGSAIVSKVSVVMGHLDVCTLAMSFPLLYLRKLSSFFLYSSLRLFHLIRGTGSVST